MKKGQAAMEFLMTYGWAILIVIVAIGALAYFGVKNPGRYLPDDAFEFDTVEEAEEKNVMLGCEGTHFHEDSQKYMPCETHEKFLEARGKT